MSEGHAVPIYNKKKMNDAILKLEVAKQISNSIPTKQFTMTSNSDLTNSVNRKVSHQQNPTPDESTP